MINHMTPDYSQQVVPNTIGELQRYTLEIQKILETFTATHSCLQTLSSFHGRLMEQLTS